MDKERIARELIGIVGSDGVATDPGELRVYETDGLTIFKAMPDIVVLPRSAEQVAGVVKVCHRERIPFVADLRSEEHTSELQSRGHLVCRLLLEKKKTQ